MFKILGIITFLLLLLMSVVSINPKWISKGEKRYTRKETLLTTLLLFALFVTFSNLDTDKNAKPTTSSISPSVTESAKTPEQIAKEKVDSDAAAKQKADADAKAKADADAKAAQVAKDKANAAPALSPDDVSKFKDYAKNLGGASFIKSAELTGEGATINYISSYSEYKSLNPNSNVSEDSYNNYWKTGDAINKTLMDIPVRLMRQFSTINKVRVVLPFENKQYSVALERMTVEKYFNFSLKDLQLPEAWTSQFVNRYENNKEERAKFAEKFISVQ